MGCNPDILENIVQRAGGPRDIYFPIYPDYNPYIISLYIDVRAGQLRKIGISEAAFLVDT